MRTLVLLPEADRAEVSRFAKNFLPILFNLYGQPVAAGDTPAPRRPVLETIKAYLTITDPQVSWRKAGRNTLRWVSVGLCLLGRPYSPGLTWASVAWGTGDRIPVWLVGLSWAGGFQMVGRREEGVDSVTHCSSVFLHQLPPSHPMVAASW